MHRRIGIGIALVSVIPVLFVLYCAVLWPREPGAGVNICKFLAYTAVAVIAVIGYHLLSKHAEDIAKLRTSIERTVSSEFPNKPHTVTAEDDISAIESYMDLIVDKLKDRMQAAELARARLQGQIHQAQKVESLSIMASGISHDFNNMFAAILGNTGIILHSVPEESPVRPNARQIESTALRATDLANLMHSYSNTDRLADEDVHITSLVREMEALVRTAIPKHIAIEYRLDDNVPIFAGDCGQVRQMIMNLVTNAADAIAEGKGVITVSTGVMKCTRDYFQDTYLDENLPEGKYVFLEVTDTGAGISPEVQEKMFDPFFTTKIRGRGLGLSVVLGVVRCHNGAIKVQSSPGKGSTFTVVFPAL